MNRIHFFRSIVLAGSSLLLLGTGAGFAKPTADRESPGLSPGEALHFDNNLRVTFINVVKDTRCPINARCATLGNAQVALRIKVGANPAKSYVLNTNRDPRELVIPANDGTVSIPKSYVISIRALKPYPYVGDPIKPTEYRLLLKIVVVQ